MDLLVSTAWLAERLGAADLRVIDAGWFLPEHRRDAAAEYRAGHIPGARFLDLATLVDPDHPAPGMAPSAADFAARMHSLGVGEKDRIVLYDDSPVHSAARAWWLFRLFGKTDVALLDGGLAAWKAEGRPLEAGEAGEVGTAAAFPARKQPELVRTKAEMLAHLAGDGAQIVDARSAPRFAGAEPEPRPDVTPGHIPGSINLPYGRLFEADGRWKRGQALRDAFAAAGVDLDRPLITTCGSGVTAAVLMLGAALLGKTDMALYDGSWAEWGADPATPKATGR